MINLFVFVFNATALYLQSGLFNSYSWYLFGGAVIAFTVYLFKCMFMRR